MKRIVFLVAGLFLICAVSSAADVAPVVIDDFEGPLTPGKTGTVDFGAGNDSKVQVSAAKDIKQSGEQSMKVMFDAVSGGYMWIARGSDIDAQPSWLVKPTDIKWEDFNSIGFFMYGANSGAKIAFDIKDNTNEIWRYIVTDDFKGWKEIVCPLADFFARSDWQPATADKNGKIDFPIKSFQFEPLPEAKGTLYFDKVMVLKK